MTNKIKLTQLTVLAVSLFLVALLLTGCTPRKPAEAAKLFNEGAYTAEAEGKDGIVKVEVTFSDSRILEIKILNQSETKGIGSEALKAITESIIKEQSLSVDTVSGATYSSNAIIAAVSEAVIQAGGSIESLKKAVARKGAGITEKLSADVVVIGAGASGTSAAVSAADKGVKVILIEKTSVIGGASNLSWAGKFYNTSVSVENGLVLDEEQNIEGWIENNHWRVDAAAIRQYVKKSKDTYTWMSDKGYQTIFLNFFGEPLHMLPSYDTREEILKTMLAESVEKNGGEVITNLAGKKLITDIDGRVTGVIAEKNDGTTVEITAESVIIATGGYAANAEMVKKAFGFEGVNGGLGQNIGEGLKMAWEAGAKVPDNFGGQMLHQTLARATGGLKKQYTQFEASYPLMLSYLPNFMNVGTSGARFRDETATLTAVAAANTSAFNGPFHYVIVSKSQMDALEQAGMNGISAPRLPGMPPEFYMGFRDQFTLENPWENITAVFDSMVENGAGFKGDSIEELAVNAGMSPDVFTETFRNYENAARTGVDEEFGKAKDYLVPMKNEGPYYAIIAEINNLGSVGGLIVNTKFQVLNEERIPVSGLYAVGLESEGVLFNDTYVGNGVGIGYAFTSGRLGGESAAENALKSRQ